MKEFPSVTVEVEVNPVPLMVNGAGDVDPVTGFGETLLMVGVVADATTLNVNGEE